jgi:hypothetical protein
LAEIYRKFSTKLNEFKSEMHQNFNVNPNEKFDPEHVGRKIDQQKELAEYKDFYAREIDQKLIEEFKVQAEAEVKRELEAHKNAM